MPERLKEHDRLPMMHRTFQMEVTRRVIKRAKAVGQGEPDAGADDDGEGAEEVYDVSLSSETPVSRWFGTEQLMHGADNVDLSRADPKDGLPMLDTHKSNMLPIGRIRGLKVGGRKLNGTVHPSQSPRGREANTLLKEGHHEMSIAYNIDEYECTPGKAGEPDAYRATKWTPYEGSMVSTPADPTVGVGRSADTGPLYPVSVRMLTPAAPAPTEIRAMPENTGAAANPAVPAIPIHVAVAQLAQRHGMADKTSEWLSAGHTVDQVREIILEARSTDPATLTRPSTNNGITPDLSAAERKEYSYTRAIMASVQMTEGRGKRVNCLETEVSDTLEKTLPAEYKRRGGLCVPMSLRAAGIPSAGTGLARQLTAAERDALATLQRTGTLDSNTLGALKEVVFTEYGGELIEILRNTAQVVRMGARVLTGLSSPIAFPRQTGDVTAYWSAENPGTDVASSNPTDDLVTLSPRTLMAASAYSRQLLVQSSIDVESMVRASIAAKHGLAWDLAAIHGSGVNNQPLGIYNQPGVGTIDFTAGTGGPYGNTGNTISYAGCIAMEVQVANQNALLNALGYLTTPGIAGDAKNTLKFPAAAIAQGGPLWEGTLLEGELNGYVARATNQISKTLGANGAPTGGVFNGLIFGNWADCLIGQFGGAMELIVDPYTKKKQGLVEVASFQMADVAIRHSGSFSVGTNLDQ
jgi:HK97 family phage major capsid protein